MVCVCIACVCVHTRAWCVVSVCVVCGVCVCVCVCVCVRAWQIMLRIELLCYAPMLLTALIMLLKIVHYAPNVIQYAQP